jgi:hypothetical protein
MLKMAKVNKSHNENCSFLKEISLYVACRHLHVTLFPDVELETFLFLTSGCWVGIFFMYSSFQMLGWLFWIGCCFGGEFTTCII